jgi:hypothetical protein
MFINRRQFCPHQRHLSVPTTKEIADPYAGVEKSVGSPSVESSKSFLKPPPSVSKQSSFRSTASGSPTKRNKDKEETMVGKIIELDEDGEFDMSATGGMFNMLQKAVSSLTDLVLYYVA